MSLDALARQYANTTAEIRAIEKHIHALHRSCEESRWLEEIPGIGPIVATALVAEVGDWKAFSSGRNLGSLDRACSQAAFDGWQGATRRHHKAGQSIFAMAARHWSYGRHPLCEAARHKAALARANHRTPTDQGRGCRAGQQDCTHGLGHDGARRTIQRAEIVPGSGIADTGQKLRRIGEGMTT